MKILSFIHTGIRNSLTRCTRIIVLAWCASTPALLFAQTYPDKPITVVVPFAPGGNADIVGRHLVNSMRKTLKQQLIIENRPGAGGGVGAAHVAKAKPDGYTLLMALSSISVTPPSDRMQGRQPSYELQQLAPIALISSDPLVFVVRSESRWKTLKEFFDDAKKESGKLSHGSSGIYGTMHVGVEMMARAANVKLLHVPYTGGAPALAALLGGQVDVIIHTASFVAAHVSSGKLRVLGVANDVRLAQYPNVPTFKEMGYNVEYHVWSGLFAPVATPPETIAILRSAVKTAIEEGDFRASFEKTGATIRYMDAPEFAKFWEKDAAQLSEIVRVLGKLD